MGLWRAYANVSEICMFPSENILMIFSPVRGVQKRTEQGNFCLETFSDTPPLPSTSAPPPPTVLTIPVSQPSQNWVIGMIHQAQPYTLTAYSL